MKLTLRLDLPDSLNKWHGKCWQAKMREKDDLCQDVCYMLYEQLGCPLPQFKKLKAKFTIHSGRITDVDNRIVVIKLVMDCLVRAKLVSDDTPDKVTYQLPEFVVEKDNRYVIVELTLMGRA